MKLAGFPQWYIQNQHILPVDCRVGEDFGGRVNERLVARELEVCHDDLGLVTFDGDFGAVDTKLRNGDCISHIVSKALVVAVGYTYEHP